MTIWKVLGLWERRPTKQPSEIVIRLQGQLNIEVGLVNQKWRPDVKTATYVKCINDICIEDIRSGWLTSVPNK